MNGDILATLSLLSNDPGSMFQRIGTSLMFKIPVVFMSMGTVVAIATQATGQVPSGTKVGTLNCQLVPSVGFVVGAHQPMRCRYTPEGPFPPESYDGVINTIGLDLGFTTGGAMAWAVIAPTVGPLVAGLPGVT